MNELLTLSATELARRIAAQENSSREIVEAHIAQIQRVNPAINAVVVERFELARQEADRADEQVRGGGKEALPPFHGVPCTIKESIALAGMPQTAGLVSRKELLPSSHSAVTTQRLLDAGAIPLGVTNTSELCMWHESNNKVWGRTNNPHNLKHIAGGSSGGEGAIVAAAGSPFGLGSDIGGSIRLPAFFNGVFGHKPTGGLVPGSGQFPNAVGDAARFMVTGPLTRRAADLMPLLKIIAGPDGEDLACTDWSLGDPGSVAIDGLPVTLVSHRENADMHGALQRAGKALQTRGATLQQGTIPGLRRAFEIWGTILGEAEGPQSFRQQLEDGTPKNLGLELLQLARGRSPHTFPALGLSLIEPFSAILSGSVSRAHERLRAMRTAFLELMGSGVVLFPSFPHTAPRHNAPLLRPFDVGYTAIFNTLEFPVTQVPMGLNSHGLPLGVQVVGPPGEDHRTIAVAMALESACGGWVPPGRALDGQH